MSTSFPDRVVFETLRGTMHAGTVVADEFRAAADADDRDYLYVVKPDDVDTRFRVPAADADPIHD